MAANKFCPNCGHPVSEDEKFCANCGQVLQEAEPSQPAESQEVQAGPVTPEPQPVAEQPQEQEIQQYSRQSPANQSKKTNKGIVVAVIVLVVLLGGYLFGRNYYTSAKQMDRFLTELADSKGDVSPYLTSSDSSLEISKDEANAFRKMFTGDQKTIDSLKSALTSSMTYGRWTWVKSGHRLLVFPAYKLQVEPVYVKLYTNHSGVKVYRDDKKLTTTTAASQVVKVGPILPGRYTFKAAGTVKGKKLSSVKTEYITYGKDNQVKLNLKTATFTVQGPENSTIYINGEKVGLLDKDGKKKFTDYPLTDGGKLYLQTKFDGKTVKSKTVSIEKELDKGNNTITPDYDGLVDKEAAEELLADAFSGLKYGEDSSVADDDFIDGENNDGYNELVAFFNSIEDNLQDVKVVKVNSIAPLEKNKARISYSVKYRFNNEDSVKIQQFTYNNAEIEKEDGSYKIKAIGKTGTEPDWERTLEE